jgi:hypothetical protein
VAVPEMLERLADFEQYMTYDLHGQWDAGNQWSSDGCPAGNCLRSHVNITETTAALVMITKAGVPSYKVMVGESSYGRSFKMAQVGCTGPMCSFLGDKSKSFAAPGQCTSTAGYISNAEIDRIMRSRSGVQSFHDGPSNTDIVVYDETEWVGYMTKITKSTRRTHWQAKNFGGTIDWAVDLQDFTDDIDGPDGPDEDEEDNLPTQPCAANYTKLEDVQRDAGQLPYVCLNLYILQALQSTLQSSLTGYDNLVKEGYDNKFNTYASAVAKSGKSQVKKFMNEHGSDYFTCVVTEKIQCCKWCHFKVGANDPYCRYCDDSRCGDYDPDSCRGPNSLCTVPPYYFKNMTQPCPPDFSQRGSSGPSYGNWAQAVYWTMIPGKLPQFYADLYNATGIPNDTISWENVRYIGCSDYDCGHTDMDYNFPVPSGYDAEDVINPKDLVSKARDKLVNVGPDLANAISRIQRDIYEGSQPDLVDAVSLPIAMVEDAVASMQTIDDTVDEWNEQKRKAILMAFLGALFMFIPILGEVVGSIVQFANIGRIIALAGLAGNTALGIYDVVKDPSNAPLAIFGLILEPLALMDVAKVSKAASFARQMSVDDIKKLGAKTTSRLSSVDSIKGMCRVKSRRDKFPVPALPMSSLTGEELEGLELAFW